MTEGKDLAKKKRKRSFRNNLNQKQLRFVAEYPKHDNAWQAAQAAGYVGRGAVTQLMSNPLIRQRIDINAAARRRNRKISTENIEEELSRMAFANPLDQLDENGKPLPLNKLPRDVAATVDKIEATRVTNRDGETVEQVKLNTTSQGDKRAALELLGKRRGMWEDKAGGANLGLAYIESLGRTVGPTGVEDGS